MFSAAQTPSVDSFRQEGMASWYGGAFDGNRTASGEIFNSVLFTAAHPTVPFGTVLTVTNVQNNRKVVVRVNDRGPFVGGRIIDLSKAAAEVLDMLISGTAQVRVEHTPGVALGPVAPEWAAPAATAFTPEWTAPAATAFAPPPAFAPVPQAAPAPVPNWQQAPAPYVAPNPISDWQQVPVQEVPEPAFIWQPSIQPTPEMAPVQAYQDPMARALPPIQMTPVPVQEPQAPVQMAPEPAQVFPVPAAPVATPSVFQAPAAQIRGTVPDPDNANLYRLQVGSYNVPRNAVIAFERVRDLGLNPSYEQHDNFYRVVLSGLRAADIPVIAQILGNAGFREVIIRQETSF